MRLVEVAEFYSPAGGGVRSYIDRKFVAAAEAGHELFVLAPGEDDAFEPRPGGGVVWLRSPQLPFDANYRVFWNAEPVHRWLDDLKPDLVEASSPWRGAWIVRRWHGTAPRAMFVHADPVASYPHRWFSPWLSRLQIDRLFSGFWSYLRRLAEAFESVVVGGPWLQRRLEDQGIARITSVALGVDTSLFSPAQRDEACRRRLLEACGQPASAKLLLGVGRHHPEKRWPLVIEATAEAARTTPVGLVLIGDGLDSARVARAAAQHPHVALMPPIRDRQKLATVLASADGLVHGCESETFGLVPAEALASGVPIVVPDVGGCARLADPAMSETYRAADPAAAAAAIRRLLARDLEHLRATGLRMAANARADNDHFEELFDHYAQLGARAPFARAAARDGRPKRGPTDDFALGWRRAPGDLAP